MKQVPMLALSLSIGAALAVLAGPAAAQTAAPSMPMQMQDHDRIYGSELMTQEERNQYQTQMRALQTEEEREAFRIEHHEKMQERARAQGKTLPDEPLENRGPGMGPGTSPGMGPGMHPGMQPNMGPSTVPPGPRTDTAPSDAPPYGTPPDGGMGPGGMGSSGGPGSGGGAGSGYRR